MQKTWSSTYTLTDGIWGHVIPLIYIPSSCDLFWRPHLTVTVNVESSFFLHGGPGTLQRNSGSPTRSQLFGQRFVTSIWIGVFFLGEEISFTTNSTLTERRSSINEFAVSFLLLVSSEAIDSRPRTVCSARSYNLIADFQFTHVSGTRRTDRLCLFIPRLYFLWSVPCCNKVDHAGRRLYAWSGRTTMVVKSFPCPVSFT